MTITVVVYDNAGRPTGPCSRCGRSCSCGVEVVVVSRHSHEAVDAVLELRSVRRDTGPRQGHPLQREAADPSRPCPPRRPWEGSLRAWT